MLELKRITIVKVRRIILVRVNNTCSKVILTLTRPDDIILTQTRPDNIIFNIILPHTRFILAEDLEDGRIISSVILTLPVIIPNFNNYYSSNDPIWCQNQVFKISLDSVWS